MAGLFGGSSVSAYNPTIRDKLALFLMGPDTKASSFRGEVVGNLLGSTGTGSTGRASMIDFTPAGGLLQAQEAGRDIATPGRLGAGLLGLATAVPIPAAKGVAKPLEKIIEDAAQKGVALSVQDGSTLALSKIVVPKAQRGQGVGTQVMQDLTEYADSTGKRMVLDPSAHFGGSVPRLKEFYGRHGFVPNKGRARDFSVSHDMYRDPKPK